VEIKINEQQYKLSQDAEKELLETIQKFIHSCPIDIEPVKKYDLFQYKSVLPLLFQIAEVVRETYAGLSTGKRLLIMNGIRMVLFKLEEKFGAEIRPPKRVDPVLHLIDFIRIKLHSDLSAFETRILPNVSIAIETNTTEITNIGIGWDKDQTRGAMASDGDVRVREDDSREED